MIEITENRVTVETKLRDKFHRRNLRLGFSLRTETWSNFEVVYNRPGFMFWQKVSFGGEVSIGLCWPYGA